MENPPFEDVFPMEKGGFPLQSVSLLVGKNRTFIVARSILNLIDLGRHQGIFFLKARKLLQQHLDTPT